MSALKRQTRKIKRDDYWVVYGPHGVITWAWVTFLDGARDFGPIGVHSARPLDDSGDDPSDDCDFMEVRCYVDAHYMAGMRLGRDWEKNGRDDDVIWAELESWYTDRLAGLAVNSR